MQPADQSGMWRGLLVLRCVGCDIFDRRRDTMLAAYRETLQLRSPPHAGSGILRAPSPTTTRSRIKVPPARETWISGRA